MNELNLLAQLGFAAALTLKHLAMCFLGVLMGQMVGVLPGIGPAAAIALLLPLTFGADPTAAIILFAGIYYGSQYGGTLTSVLVSVPGESSTVMTSIDGYQMALQGRAGPALGIAAIGSFIAGTLGTLGLMLLAPPLAQAALAFGPPEYFALVVLGLTALAAVGCSPPEGPRRPASPACSSRTIGIDPQNGIARFDFGQTWLLDGVEFIVLTVALFGVGEVRGELRARRDASGRRREERAADARRLARVRACRSCAAACIGFLIGVLPATGATIASFVAYIVEKKVAKDPSRFGKGAIEGVAAPGVRQQRRRRRRDGADALARRAGFGHHRDHPRRAHHVRHPPGAGALHQERRPGVGGDRQHVHRQPDPAGAEPAARRPVRAPAQDPYRWLYPPILALCIAGVYSQANSVEDCWLLVGFGVLGWLMKRYDWSTAPMILGLVLGPLFETALRQSLTLSHGSGRSSSRGRSPPRCSRSR